MEERTSGGRARPWWGLIALLLTGLLIGASLVGSAGAHVGTPGHLWKKHIKPKADQRYAWHVKYVRSDPVTVDVGEVDSAEAVCPSGWVVIGGGGASSIADGSVPTIWSFPSDGSGNDRAGRTAWTYMVQNEFVGFGSIRAYAICTRVGKVGGNYTPGANQV